MRSRKKRQERKLYSIHKKIDKLYDDGRLDSEDIKPLEDLLSETEDAYAKGKINNERYTNLKIEILVLYEEIFRKKIDSLSLSVTNRKAVLDKTKEDISDAYSKGKITKLHYDLLNERFYRKEGWHYY